MGDIFCLTVYKLYCLEKPPILPQQGALLLIGPLEVVEKVTKKCRTIYCILKSITCNLLSSSQEASASKVTTSTPPPPSRAPCTIPTAITTKAISSITSAMDQAPITTTLPEKFTKASGPTMPGTAEALTQ